MIAMRLLSSLRERRRAARARVHLPAADARVMGAARAAFVMLGLGVGGFSALDGDPKDTDDLSSMPEFMRR
jgi:hypothetical protein